jgi:hypothetical protein
MGKRTTLAVWVGVAFLAMAATAVVADPLVQNTSPSGIEATPEQAVAMSVQTDSAMYAGDCAGASSPQDIGKACSKFVSERGTMRAYLTGRAFSEFSAWVFVEQTGGGWRLVSTAPLDSSAMTMSVPWPASS